MKGIIALIAIIGILSVVKNRQKSTAGPVETAIAVNGEDTPQVSTHPTGANLIGIMAQPLPPAPDLKTLDLPEDFNKIILDIKKSIDPKTQTPLDIPLVYW